MKKRNVLLVFMIFLVSFVGCAGADADLATQAHRRAVAGGELAPESPSASASVPPDRSGRVSGLGSFYRKTVVDTAIRPSSNALSAMPESGLRLARWGAGTERAYARRWPGGRIVDLQRLTKAGGGCR